jgi:hypothetical protein
MNGIPSQFQRRVFQQDFKPMQKVCVKDA